MSAGTDSGDTSGGTSAGSATATAGEQGGDEGCGCRSEDGRSPWWALLLLPLLPRRMSRRTART